MQQSQRARLQFLVRFVQMDLNVLRPGDWLNLRDDLRRYVSPGGLVWVVNTDDPRWEKTSEGVIKAIQERAAGLLQSLVGAQEEVREGRQVYKQVYKQDAAHVQVQSTTGTLVPIGAHKMDILLNQDDGNGTISNIIRHNMAQAHDTFFLAMTQHLSHESGDSLRRCPACSTLFVRSGKQRYCSRTCVNRVSTRRWRLAAAHRETDRRRARDRYARKVKGHTNVKVRRNQTRKPSRDLSQDAGEV